MDIKDKSVVITGAGAGIGRAGALAFAERQPATVHLVDINPDGLAETTRLVSEISPNTAVRTSTVDLSILADVEEWLTSLDAHGGYDIFYNNAGAVMPNRFAFPETPVDRLEWIIRLNLISVILCTQRAAEHLGKRGGGVIVNTSSVVALEGSPDTLYSTTKAGVLMFTRSCAGLQESKNVRVAGILPGEVDTDALRNACAEIGFTSWLDEEVAKGMVAAPSDIANVVIELVKNDELPGGSCVLAKLVDGKMTQEPIAAFG